MLLVTAVALASLAVACSALLRRTQAATVVAYGLTLGMVVGTFVVYGAQRALDGPGDRATPTVLVLNPFVATADVVRGRGEGALESPFTALQQLLRVNVGPFGRRPGDFIDPRFDAIEVVPAMPTVVDGPALRGIPPPLPPPGGAFDDFAGDRFVAPEERRSRVAGLPFWVASLLVFAGLTAAGLALAVRRISLPSARDAS